MTCGKKFSLTGGVVVKITVNPKYVASSVNAPSKFFGLVVDQISTTVDVSSFNSTFNPNLGDVVIGINETLHYIHSSFWIYIHLIVIVINSLINFNIRTLRCVCPIRQAILTEREWWVRFHYLEQDRLDQKRNSLSSFQWIHGQLQRRYLLSSQWKSRIQPTSSTREKRKRSGIYTRQQQ